MAVGGALGMTGVALPYVEIGIAVSVVALGVVLAFQWKFPLAVAAVLVGLFAIFHGHAHGGEMPDAASGVEYGAGFVLATALLHCAGIGLGLAIGLLADNLRTSRTGFLGIVRVSRSNLGNNQCRLAGVPEGVVLTSVGSVVVTF